MLALENIKILDLAHRGPGAWCTMLLGDFGADVIKVQALSELGYTSPGDSRGKNKTRTLYDAVNRNKKSLGLDLRSEAGRQIFHRLAQDADVILEGFRPGVVKRLGIDFETIQKINPRIVYCSLSGFGQSGPYADLPGHDINYLALSGILSLIGNRDGPPIVPLNFIADIAGAALHGVIGILIALMARGKTGEGQYVDIAYLDAAISLLAFYASEFFATGTVMKRGETALHGAYPYYGVYETRDGKYISLGCLEPRFWENLCRALGKENYLECSFSPPHFFTAPVGAKWVEVRDGLKKIFLTRTRDEWAEFLAKHDVPAAKVNTIDEAFNDPQVRHREMVLELEHPQTKGIKQVGHAIKLSATPARVRGFAPAFGGQTDDILSALGYTSEDINDFRQSKVIS